MCCAFKLLSNLFLSGKYLRMKGWVTQYVFLYSGIKEVILFEGCETAANDFPWNFDVTREGKNDVVQKNWSGNQIRSIDIPNLANQTQSNSLWNSIVPKGWNLNAKKIPFFVMHTEHWCYMLGLVFVTQMCIRICIDSDTEVPSQIIES